MRAESTLARAHQTKKPKRSPKKTTVDWQPYETRLPDGRRACCRLCQRFSPRPSIASGRCLLMEERTSGGASCGEFV
jgi:hypothetical protein